MEEKKFRWMSRYQKAAIRLARSTACFFLPFGWIERVCWPRKTNWKKSDWRTTRTRFDGWPNDLITARTLWWLCPSNYNMLQSSVGSPLQSMSSLPPVTSLFHIGPRWFLVFFFLFFFLCSTFHADARPPDRSTAYSPSQIMHPYTTAAAAKARKIESKPTSTTTSPGSRSVSRFWLDSGRRLPTHSSTIICTAGCIQRLSCF